MTLKEPPASRDDPFYRDIPGADILDECDAQRRPRSVRKPRRKPRELAAVLTVEEQLYAPTAKEAAAAARVLERRQTSKPRLDFAVDHTGGGQNLSEVHPDKVVAQVALLDSFATANTHFSQALLLQLAGISVNPGSSAVDGKLVSQAVAMVQGIGPRDEVEAMLATQMVAVHNAVMQSASSLQCAKTLMAQEAAAGMLQKFGKTFAAQIEALKIHRSSGEQHIHVHRHGFEKSRNNQGGGAKNSAPQSHEPKAIADAADRSSPLLRKIEAVAAAVPIPCSEG